MFLLGNLATLLVVGAMLFAYRYFDLRSRSLGKTKRYADRIAKRLAETIEQNTSAVHDLAIELQVNLKTGKELLKRIRDVEDHLDARTREAQRCTERIAGQVQTVDTLAERTGELAAGVRRITEECRAAAAVAERLDEMGAACSGLEQRIEGIAASVDGVKELVTEVTARQSELPDMQRELAHVEQMNAEVKRRVTELRNQSRHVDALQDNLRTMEQSVAHLRPGVAEVSDIVAGLQRQVEVVASGSDPRRAGDRSAWHDRRHAERDRRAHGAAAGSSRVVGAHRDTAGRDQRRRSGSVAPAGDRAQGGAR